MCQFGICLLHFSLYAAKYIKSKVTIVIDSNSKKPGIPPNKKPKD